MAELVDAQQTKCVKRRRRSPSSYSSIPLFSEKQLPHTLLHDQTTTTTTTTKRSSRFRGVSRHRWTGRFEAHLWDKGSWNETQKKKGKQVYLGAYDEEEAAARVYDLAAIKYWGASTYTNFSISDYSKDIEIMQNITKEEYLASLRRKSSGFARGVSKYRGVARHHHNGRWEARIGNKYLYLGTEEEAGHAYDIAAVEYRGMNAVTKFDLRWLRPPENSHKAILQVDSPSNISNSFSIKNPAISDKHEIIERKMPLTPWNNATSPTALGLLLRSSLFKQLLQKTATTAVEGNHEEDHHFAQQNASTLYQRAGQALWNAL